MALAPEPKARRPVVEDASTHNRCVRIQVEGLGNAEVVAVPNDGGDTRIGSIEFL